MNLEDVDFEAEWDKFRETIGDNSFHVRYYDDKDVVKFYDGGGFNVTHGLVSVWMQMGLIICDKKSGAINILSDGAYGLCIDIKEPTNEY